MNSITHRMNSITHGTVDSLENWSKNVCLKLAVETFSRATVSVTVSVTSNVRNQLTLSRKCETCETCGVWCRLWVGSVSAR